MRGALLIPFAVLGDGTRVAAAVARRRDTPWCPGCGRQLTLRAGSIRQPHFAHRSGFVGHGEGETHRLVKHHLAYLIEQARERGRPRFPVAELCRWCGRPVNRLLPDFARVAVEWQMSAERRADVALLDGDNRPAMVVEVMVSHSTDPTRVAPEGTPWLEVEVIDALDPTAWRVSSNWRGLRCSNCARLRKLLQLVAAEETAKAAEPRALQGSAARAGKAPEGAALASGASAPTEAAWPDAPSVKPATRAAATYRSSQVRCARCGASQPFFDWAGNPPPEPRPATVRRFRWELPAAPLGQNPYSPAEITAIARGAWANYCGQCGALLGDRDR